MVIWRSLYCTASVIANSIATLSRATDYAACGCAGIRTYVYRESRKAIFPRAQGTLLFSSAHSRGWLVVNNRKHCGLQWTRNSSPARL